jgi:hypothetical protein
VGVVLRFAELIAVAFVLENGVLFRAEGGITASGTAKHQHDSIRLAITTQCDRPSLE